MTKNYEVEYPVSRETLYELAWSQPMTSIAEIFGVSSSYLARVYSRTNVPKPAPGYWAKVAAGKPVKKPELPDPGPNDLLDWDRYNDGPLKERPAPKPPKRTPTRISIPKLSKSQKHPLIRNAKQHFLKFRESLFDDIGYIRPYKRNLVDLIISHEQLDTALTLANTVFTTFEDFGYPVCLDQSNDFRYTRPAVDEREKSDNRNRPEHHWIPGRETLVYVGSVAIGLTIYEYSEELEAQRVDGKYVPITKIRARDRHHWSYKHDFPTGRFCIRAYSPYRDTSWTYSWDISPANAAPEAEKIAKQLKGHASTVATLVKEAKIKADIADREWKEQQKKWKEEDERRQKEKSIKDSQAALLQLIDIWAEVKKFEGFFQEIESSLAGLPPNERDKLTERLNLAKELVGAPNALKALSEWKTPEELLIHAQH